MLGGIVSDINYKILLQKQHVEKHVGWAFYSKYIEALWNNLQAESKRCNRLKWFLVFTSAIIIYVLIIDSEISYKIPLVGISLNKENLLLLAPVTLVGVHWVCILVMDKLKAHIAFMRSLYNEVLEKELRCLMVIQFTHLKYFLPTITPSFSFSNEKMGHVILRLKKGSPLWFTFIPLLIELWLGWEIINSFIIKNGNTTVLNNLLGLTVPVLFLIAADLGAIVVSFSFFFVKLFFGKIKITGESYDMDMSALLKGSKPFDIA